MIEWVFYVGKRPVNLPHKKSRVLLRPRDFVLETPSALQWASKIIKVNSAVVLPELKNQCSTSTEITAESP